MKFGKIKNTKFKSCFAVMMCALTAVLSLVGCSFAYTLDEDAADNIASGVYSSESSTEERTESSEDEQSVISDSEVVSEENDVDEDIPKDDISEDTTVTYTFRNDKLLNDHFEKHNEDFGYATVEEYVEGANRVINNENSLHKLEAEDGDDVYYLEETNEFVIVSTDGYIRTYFKPSRGIDYYNRQ